MSKKKERWDKNNYGGYLREAWRDNVVIHQTTNRDGTPSERKPYRRRKRTDY